MEYILFTKWSLKNPFYVKNLKNLDGKNKKIIQFVKNQKHFSEFFDTINDLFKKMINGFKDEGKDYITVAFGCTGGVHRSVVSSEMFFLNLKSFFYYKKKANTNQKINQILSLNF